MASIDRTDAIFFDRNVVIGFGKREPMTISC